MGKKRYKVPKDLRLWLQKRDQECRSPWCDRSAFRTDIDHTRDWAKGGATDAVNLACLCELCHRMKHLSTWTVSQGNNGVLEWTSPTGRKHVTRPAAHQMRESEDADSRAPSSAPGRIRPGALARALARAKESELPPGAPPPF